MKGKLLIRSQNYLHFIDQSDIVYCRSDDSYTVVYVNNRSHTVSQSLAKFSKELDEAVFVRVSQSYMINRKCVKAIDKKNKTIELVDNVFIPFTITLKELLLLLLPDDVSAS